MHLIYMVDLYFSFQTKMCDLFSLSDLTAELVVY